MLSLSRSIDLLINNASTFYPTPIDDISEDHWEKLIGSNLKGPMFLIKGLKQKLKESNNGVSIKDGSWMAASNPI